MVIPCRVCVHEFYTHRCHPLQLIEKVHCMHWIPFTFCYHNMIMKIIIIIFMHAKIKRHLRRNAALSLFGEVMCSYNWCSRVGTPSNDALFEHLVASSTLKQFRDSIYSTHSTRKVLQAIKGLCLASAYITY